MTAPSADMFWVEAAHATGATFRTRSRNATLTLARLKHDGAAERVFQSRKADAQLAIIQISVPPRHHLTCGGGAQRHTGGAPGSFNFADLNAAPACRVLGPFDSMHLHIPRAALDDLADEADSPPIDGLRAPDGWQTLDPIVGHIHQTLLAATERPAEVSQIFIDHMMLALHAHLARRYGGMRDAQRRRLGGLAPWQTRLAREMIAGSLAKEVSIAEIAGQCGLSAAHFARGFKTATGLTPHGWLQSCRVERAKALLSRPELSLAEIALACGFADQSHFTRIFTRRAGDTPGAWRRFRRAA